MPATLRLMRFGKKRNPAYRIVVMDKRKARDTRYIESLGIYNPMQESGEIQIDRKRFDHWISRGAVLSDGLTRLLKNKKRVNFQG